MNGMFTYFALLRLRYEREWEERVKDVVDRYYKVQCRSCLLASWKENGLENE